MLEVEGLELGISLELWISLKHCICLELWVSLELCITLELCLHPELRTSLLLCPSAFNKAFFKKTHGQFQLAAENMNPDEVLLDGIYLVWGSDVGQAWRAVREHGQLCDEVFYEHVIL